MRQLFLDRSCYRYELQAKLAQDDQDLGRGSYPPNYGTAQSSNSLETLVKPDAGNQYVWYVHS
jgi:hypothetical protein